MAIQKIRSVVVNETLNDAGKIREVKLELVCGHEAVGDSEATYETGTEIICSTCEMIEAGQRAKAEAERAQWLNHCNARVYPGGSFRSQFCSKKVKVVRDVRQRIGFGLAGDQEKIETVKKAFCSQHDPETIARKANEERDQRRRDQALRDKVTDSAKDRARRLHTWMPEFKYEPGTETRSDGNFRFTGSIILNPEQVEQVIEKLQLLQQLEAAVEIPLAALVEKCRHGNDIPAGSADKATSRSDYCEECQAEMIERDRILRSQP
jgi:ribosomal protein L7/L12